MSVETSTVEPCPDDELLAGFVASRLDPAARAQVEVHVAACPTCLDVVAASLPAAEISPALAPPAPAVTRARTRRPATHARRWAIAAAIMLMIGAGLTTLKGPAADLAVPALSRLATRMLGTPFHADTVTTAFGANLSTLVVSLNHVSIGKASGRLLTAERIAVTIGLTAPLWGTPVMTSVHVRRPVVQLTAESVGNSSWPREGGRVFALLAVADRAEVEDGRVLLSLPNDAPLEIVDLNGGTQHVDDGTRVVLTGRIGGGTVAATGTLASDGRRIHFIVGGRDLDAGQLPLLAARMTGTAELRIDVTHVGNSPRVDGRIAVRGGRWLGPSPLADLSPEDRAIFTSVRPDLGGAALPFEDGRAMFRWRSGTWSLRRVYVSAAGILAGGRGRVAADGRLNARGTLRLPADLITALAGREPTLAAFRDRSGTATLPFTVGGSAMSPRFALGRP